jgi:hypothetical protein
MEQPTLWIILRIIRRCGAQGRRLRPLPSPSSRSVVPFVVKRFSDVSDLHVHLPLLSALYNRINRPHPAIFLFLLQTKTFSPIVAWASLGWRLGDPWVTQESPNPRPNPNPSRQRVVKSSKNTKRNGFPVAADYFQVLANSPSLHSVPLINMTDRRLVYCSK